MFNNTPGSHLPRLLCPDDPQSRIRGRLFIPAGQLSNPPLLCPWRQKARNYLFTHVRAILVRQIAKRKVPGMIALGCCPMCLLVAEQISFCATRSDHG
jgi:hypothetical protein